MSAWSPWLGAVALLVAAQPSVAGPPPWVDVEDIQRWEGGAEALLDGPPGCWLFEGQVEVRLAMHQAPDGYSGPRRAEERFRGTFVGQMADGDWKRFDYQLTDRRGGIGLEVPIFPLIGRMDQRVVNQERRARAGSGAQIGVGRAEVDEAEGRGTFTVSFNGRSVRFSIDDISPMNLLRKAVDDWGSDVSTAYAQWNDDTHGVMLFRDVPIDNSPRAPEVVVKSFFPGGRPMPTRMDAIWPKKVVLGKFPAKVHLRNAQMHLRGTYAYDMVLPTVEVVALLVNALGYNLGYEQKITYTRASSCGGPARRPRVQPDVATEPGGDGSGAD